MVDFQLTVKHTAVNEAGMNTFLVFVKDNYPTVVQSAQANSENLYCQTDLVFTAYNDAVNAVQAFKAQFSIQYILQVNK